MGSDIPRSHASATQIPTHVTGPAREMYERIVAELTRRNSPAGLTNTSCVEKLALQLARIREVSPLVRFGYSIASAAEAITSQCWLRACEFAADLQLTPDELKQLVQ